LLTHRFVWLITWQGFLLSAVTLAAFYMGLQWYGSNGDGLRRATTIAFMTLALAQVFHAFNARSPRRSAFDQNLFANAWLWAAVAGCILLQIAAVYVPLLQRVLHTTSLTASDWLLILASSLLPLVIVELMKLAAKIRT
jgi:Ca2+-transporting ATPase